MIGVGLIGLSAFFFTLSFIMMLDRGFLILANLSFFIGVVTLIGISNAFGFFFRDSKRKASACYFAGLLIIIFGYTLIGFILQIYGIFLLFKDFIKIAFSYVQNMPLIGPLVKDNQTVHGIINYISSSG